MYDLQYNVDLDSFLTKIDPLKTYNLITYLQHPNLFEIKNKSLPCFATTFGDIAITNLLRVSEPPSRNLWEIVNSDTRSYGYTLSPEIDYPVVLDTGASMSLTPNKTDFVTKIKPLTDKNIKGLNGSSAVKGIGTVEWFVIDYWNVTRKIRTEAYYVLMHKYDSSHLRTIFKKTTIMEVATLQDKKSQLLCLMEECWNSLTTNIPIYPS